MNLTMSRADEGLAAGRIAASAGAWLLPGLAARIIGVQPTPATALILRLFAARELAVGIAYLQADADKRQRLLLVGMAMDGADGIASLIAGKQGGLRWTRAVVLTLAAGAAVATAAQVRNS